MAELSFSVLVVLSICNPSDKYSAFRKSPSKEIKEIRKKRKGIDLENFFLLWKFMGFVNVFFCFPDIVSICTWHSLHHIQTIDIARRGVKAIICEKPMAIGSGPAQEMLDACKENDVELIILNSVGQLVYNENYPLVTNFETQLDIENYSSGIYQILISTKKGFNLNKLVLKE